MSDECPRGPNGERCVWRPGFKHTRCRAWVCRAWVTWTASDQQERLGER